MQLQGKTIVVGISGGIAAYKSVQLVSDLKKLGAIVHVVMTKNSAQFVSPLSLEVISENKVCGHEPLTSQQEINHIKLAEIADLILIAPATANCMAKLASGMSDEMIYDTVLATKAPVVIAPAMNTNMWQHPLTQENYRKLKAIGYNFVDPAVGELACKTVGQGRLAEFEELINKVTEMLGADQKFSGKKILITLGATREKIDPVRYLTNESSGKMGFALAREALNHSAQVTLVSTIQVPPEIKADRVIYVESHEEMQAALRDEFPKHDVLIMVAAVADYKPRAIAAQKIKTQQSLTLEFDKTSDIVAELAASKRADQTVVAFSVETDDPINKAQDKIQRKNLDLIVVNSPAAFGADEAEVVIVDSEGELTRLSKSSKSLIATKLLQCLKPQSSNIEV